jgi:catalase-peroxidase
MFTTDLALKFDPVYAEISKKFHADHAYFSETFAKAWYKLTHRDMGPITRCQGPLVAPVQIWQDPVPDKPAELIGEADVSALKETLLGSGLSPEALIRTAWASASTFRRTDFRGGANGARIRLAPQKDWAANNPEELAATLAKLEEIKAGCGKDVSIADLIVLGGSAAVEAAAKKGGVDVSVPFFPGRTDATDEQTDANSFAVLEPKTDPFRNYGAPTPHQMIDKAHMLGLTAPEMTCLLGGLRVLGISSGSTGVLTTTPGTLNNDFFVNLLDMATTWELNAADASLYDGKSLATGETKWTASQCDLVFGSNSELRAIAEHYGMSDMSEAFCADFAAVFGKVMNNDRFDLA